MRINSWRNTLKLVGLLVACAGPLQAKEPVPYDADQALVYKEVNGKPLHLYLYKPQGWAATDQRPALVYIHGGGWVGGTPSMAQPQVKTLLPEGMVVISVRYRLTSRAAVNPAICIEDAKSAMRYVRSHAAELGIDPNRIAACGSSAGGHLSAACALLPTFDAVGDDLKVSCKPNALVLLQPVLDNGPDGGYGGSAPAIQKNVQAYSPAHNVTPGAPPTIIFGGREDMSARLPLLEKFTANMKKAGNNCELYSYEGKHGFVSQEPTRTDINQKTVAFFHQLGWLPLKGVNKNATP